MEGGLPLAHHGQGDAEIAPVTVSEVTHHPAEEAPQSPPPPDVNNFAAWPDLLGRRSSTMAVVGIRPLPSGPCRRIPLH